MLLQIARSLFVVDKLGYRRVIATELTMMIWTGADLAEIHRLSVEGKKFVGEEFSYTCDVLQRLGCLNGSEHSCDSTKYSSL